MKVYIDNILYNFNGFKLNDPWFKLVLVDEKTNKTFRGKLICYKKLNYNYYNIEFSVFKKKNERIVQDLFKSLNNFNDIFDIEHYLIENKIEYYIDLRYPFPFITYGNGNFTKFLNIFKDNVTITNKLNSETIIKDIKKHCNNQCMLNKDDCCNDCILNKYKK